MSSEPISSATEDTFLASAPPEVTRKVVPWRDRWRQYLAAGGDTGDGVLFNWVSLLSEARGRSDGEGFAKWPRIHHFLRADESQRESMRMSASRSLSPLLASAAVLLLLSSCQTLQFYGQALGGQVEILRQSRPSEQVIADAETSPAVRRQLVAVEGIRKFASDFLSLPGHKSYGKYADLGREHVVWVLYAAPEFSLKPKTWHYLAVGEMGYRGYFRKQETVDLSHELKAEGYDVFVGGVDAYSTLGWFHDPVLNTFVGYPDIDLAETIFHELTHRKVFRWGDTVFNESLANTVAEAGVKRWLKHHGRHAELRNYQGRLGRRREFYREIDRARSSLVVLYASGQPASVMREKKAAILVKLRDQFRDLRRRWGGRGLESWLREDINNGHIVSLNLYADQMPLFENLLTECDKDLDLFFQKVTKLKLPKHCND